MEIRLIKMENKSIIHAKYMTEVIINKDPFFFLFSVFGVFYSQQTLIDALASSIFALEWVF